MSSFHLINTFYPVFIAVAFLATLGVESKIISNPSSDMQPTIPASQGIYDPSLVQQANEMAQLTGEEDDDDDMDDTIAPATDNTGQLQAPQASGGEQANFAPENEFAPAHLVQQAALSSAPPPRSADLKTSASHHYHGHGVKGWLDMGAWTGKKGAFGWHSKHPVGKKGRK